jgi:hypothetical protein
MHRPFQHGDAALHKSGNKPVSEKNNPAEKPGCFVR